MTFGADDPELAETIRKLYEGGAVNAQTPDERAIIQQMLDLPEPAREGNATKGFLAMLAIGVIAVAALAVALFILGFLAHAAVAGWDAL